MACGAWLELGSVIESARAVLQTRSALRARSMYAELGAVSWFTLAYSANKFAVDRARSALRLQTALADSFTLPSSSQAPQAIKRSAD